MRFAFNFFLIIVTSCIVLSGIKAQEGEILNTLEPSYYNNYEQQEESISNLCLEDIFQDNQGRLWVDNCGVQRILNSVGFFQFDGYSFWPIELQDKNSDPIKLPRLLGIGSDGHFFGLGNRRELIVFDPNTRQSQIIPFMDSLGNRITVKGVNEYNGIYFAIGSTEDAQNYLVETKDGFQEKTWTLEQGLNYPKTKIGLPLVITEDEIWTMGQTLPIVRIDRKSNTKRYYGPEDFTYPRPDPGVSEHPKFKPILITNKNKEVFLFLPNQDNNHLFKLDRKLDQFVKMEGPFSAYGQPEGIFKDNQENICFLFIDKNGNYRSILQDTLGELYDFSAILSGQQGIVYLKGDDFFKEILVADDEGLTSIGVRNKIDIRQALKGKWISSIAELSDQKFLVNTVNEGWFILDDRTGNYAVFPESAKVDGIDPFSRGMVQQLILDAAGNLWFTKHERLFRYDPVKQSVTTYLRDKITLFGFVKKNLIVVQTETESISFFNLDSRKYESFNGSLKTNLNGFIRDLFTDSKGNLWVPTNNGLWRLNFDEGTIRVLNKQDGFADVRFTCIHEASDGKLWIGTYFGGLHIYDPQNGQITVIDARKGLTNNAVMSIIADKNEDIWVTTEKGITILSSKGEIISNLYQEDGLLTDQFERFDPFRSKDGRLFIGSSKGINIIDPQRVKDGLNTYKKPQIYFTEVVYFDKASEKEVVLNSNFDHLKPIRIPAKRPFIKLKFGLSSYLQPQLNSYAYMLEGKDSDWVFLGSQPELNIDRLPPGRYRLLIKGADFRNNWTVEPIGLDIYAQDFFYRQWWFFVLCTIPFFLFGGIWARTKLLENRRLEQEVFKRTKHIEEDKMLIEEQAEELKQLDTLKSRFFTNISHEFRTPVTLITAPVEHLLNGNSSELNDRTKNSLNIIHRNALKLRKLVEELLELSSLEANKVSLNEVPTHINVFCRQLFSAFDSAAKMKSIEYGFHSGIPDNACYWVDQNRLEKIINNLLSNAIKFTPDHGTISLFLNIQENKVHISVKDTGRGIPAEDILHIFDRYFQTNNQKITTEGGTGIGLALSQELARLMKGEITVVESESGKGTTFRLVMPARKAKPVSKKTEVGVVGLPGIETLAPDTGIETITSQKGATGVKILIVEDNPDMQQLLLSLLSEKYNCIVTNNGKEAWTLLDSEDPSVKGIELILSDIMMPVMDGYSLLSRIKKHPTWQQLPVIMLTARAAEEDKLQALRMGVDDYLLKPFSPNELWVRVANLVSNYQNRKKFESSLELATASVDTTFEAVPSFDQSFLEKIEYAAKEALDKQIKLTTSYLAAQVFISERQLSRRLKSITGLTPNNYILEIKLQKTRFLLENKTFGTVSEVAQTSGFSSSSYLAKVYRERFGKSPGEYFS